MSARLGLPLQIAALNSACEMISANEASIRAHGWQREELDAVYIGLGAMRTTAEWLLRHEDKIRAACAPANMEASTHA